MQAGRPVCLPACGGRRGGLLLPRHATTAAVASDARYTMWHNKSSSLTANLELGKRNVAALDEDTVRVERYSVTHEDAARQLRAGCADLYLVHHFT
jgi:hypothetical protein